MFFVLNLNSVNISEIISKELIQLTSEDAVSKSLNLMYEHNINQIPIIDSSNKKYIGMIFAKNFLDINIDPNSKLKNFIVHTPFLSKDDNIDKARDLIISTGHRALPVVDNNERLVGIVSESDLIQHYDFGNNIVDTIMSGAIVIEETNLLSNIISKMKRYHISRLPVINKKGLLTGIVGSIDLLKVLSLPKERSGSSPRSTSTKTKIKDIAIRDFMRSVISVEPKTQINQILPHFIKNDEIVVIGNGIPIGIVTSKDILELTIKGKSEPMIHIAHVFSETQRSDIENQILKFLRKINDRLDGIQSIIIYADTHKTKKYSLRARIVTNNKVIISKAVGFNILSVCKDLIIRLNKQIRIQHNKKTKSKKQEFSSRVPET